MYNIFNGRKIRVVTYFLYISALSHLLFIQNILEKSNCVCLISFTVMSACIYFSLHFLTIYN